MTVSVALCTYNGEKYIREQLESIIEQFHVVDEIIVSDDNSSDNTLVTVKKVLDNSNIPYRIITHDINVGTVKNFMECISNCSGDVVFTSDQDDVWKDNKVEMLLKCFEDSKVSLAFADADIVDENMCSLGCTHWQKLNISKEKVDNDLFAMLLKDNVIAGSSMAFRRSVFEKTGGVSKGFWHDDWIALNAYGYGKICAVETPLIYYRQHANNQIGAKKTTIRQKWKNYANSFAKIKKYRAVRKRMYEDFSKQPEISLTEDENDKLAQCILFWKGTINLESMSVISGIVWIVKNYANGNYNKFFTGKRGAIRDFITLFAH
jgi:glycosyltransferase involved in cell wall biosynthesis